MARLHDHASPLSSDGPIITHLQEDRIKLLVQIQIHILTKT